MVTAERVKQYGEQIANNSGNCDEQLAYVKIAVTDKQAGYIAIVYQLELHKWEQSCIVVPCLANSLPLIASITDQTANAEIKRQRLVAVISCHRLASEAKALTRQYLQCPVKRSRASRCRPGQTAQVINVVRYPCS